MLKSPRFFPRSLSFFWRAMMITQRVLNPSRRISLWHQRGGGLVMITGLFRISPLKVQTTLTKLPDVSSSFFYLLAGPASQPASQFIAETCTKLWCWTKTRGQGDEKHAPSTTHSEPRTTWWGGPTPSHDHLVSFHFRTHGHFRRRI